MSEEISSQEIKDLNEPESATDVRTDSSDDYHESAPPVRRQPLKVLVKRHAFTTAKHRIAAHEDSSDASDYRSRSLPLSSKSRRPRDFKPLKPKDPADDHLSVKRFAPLKLYVDISFLLYIRLIPIATRTPN